MPSNIGFNDTTIINSDDKSTLLAMFDKLTRIADGRRITPHDQLDNVTYAHRALFDDYCLQIGDSYFMIPPEFICVTSESTSQQIVTLRQENSMRQKAGSRKRTLLVDLVFNGYEQINGYRVEGAESADGKDYYVDGLRQLLAQFKCTPFLPIQNEFINGVHGIHTVVLQGITISTVPGFPTLMTAQLTLQEVEMFPYLEAPSIVFKSMIDWDLFRYYYQRFLTDSYEYKKLQSLPVDKDYNRFKISILKESVFTDGLDETEVKYGNKNDALLRQICDNDNYNVWVDSSVDNVKINAFQCGYYNILTNIQLNDTPTPTVQFMGGMDTIFNISIETTDVNVVTAIEQCRMYNDTMVRNNAKYRSLGFVKLESELVSFTGSLFVVIDNVVTSTTPEFPGLYQIQLQCVSFDIGQSARENLNGFLPFDDDIAKELYKQKNEDIEDEEAVRKYEEEADEKYSGSCAKLTEDGYVSDHVHEEQVIEQSMNGLLTKIRQDCYAEWKLRSTMELYPDMYLPTYAEVDSFIFKCSKFRKSKGLDPLPYNKYPTRPECMLQGLPVTNNVKLSGDIILAKDVPHNSEYEGFVDPDFYVFYPNSYQSFDLDCYDLYTPSTRSSFSKDITISVESSDDLMTDSSSANEIFIEHLIDKFINEAYKQLGKRYVWGAEGPDAFDCSGYVWYCLTKAGALPSNVPRASSPSATVSVITRSPETFKKIPWEEKRRGDLIVKYDNKAKRPSNCKHVMIYLGDNQVIHAANSKRGVVTDHFNNSNILYDAYRPVVFESDTVPTSTSNASSNSKGTVEESQDIMWGVLKSLGYGDIAAAGIIGCWTKESGCKPKRIEGDYLKSFNNYGGYDMVFNSDQMNKWTKNLFQAYQNAGKSIKRSAYYGDDGNLYPGIGLAQWTGPRGQKFLKFAGNEWHTLEKQMEFAVMELQSSYAKTNSSLKNAKDATQAAIIFCQGYEGYSGDSTSRQKTAEEVYARLKGTAGVAYSSSASSNNAQTQNTRPKGDVLTQAEFDSICKTICGQLGNFAIINNKYNTSVLQNTSESTSGDIPAYSMKDFYQDTQEYYKEALGLAQMIYDMLTCNQVANGLGVILNNKGLFPHEKSETVPDDISDIVKSVFCDNSKRWPESTVAACLVSTSESTIGDPHVFDKMYERISDSESGKILYWQKTPPRASSDRKFTIIDDQTAGSASSASYDTTTTVNYEARQAELDKFAEPVFVRTDAILYKDEQFKGWFGKDNNWNRRKEAKEVLNDGANIFGSSFVDEAQYSCRGRLVRAFPTYMFCILDDNTQWYMGNKLWTNYYMRKSVVDIQVHEANDMPIATAVLTVSNVYGNLSVKQRGLNNYNIKDELNNRFNKIPALWYKLTNQVLDFASPNLTDNAIKLKQVIYDNAKIREGTRAHIRMGYGSDPLSLAPVMNGTITDVSVGDQLTIVVTSDGVELTQHITSATERTNNGWLGLFGLGEDQESSNLIANILCKRDSIINYFVSEWYEGSKYGIEHFGLYFNQSVTGLIQSISTGAITVTGTVAGSAIKGGVLGGALGALAGVGIGTLLSFVISSDISIKDLWDGYSEQYDICKNLYKADYSREHYIYANFGEFDNEQNICFNEANMTPWDVMQIATQQVPEYIVKPSYHQFDSRIYFGLPFWMEKYRYDYLGGMVYEECKASTQVHMVESVTNIIDNQVKVTNRYNDTNKKVLYVRGESAISTKVIHSDDTIYYGKQKTGIIDSAVTQDILGPDALLELFSIYNVGREAARRIGISNLLYEWQLQYQGEIICTGLPGVKAHDYILLNDTYVSMVGIAIVREVTHSFSTNTGFTTSITPGMVGFSSDQRSGLIVAIQNYMQVFNAFSSFLMIRNMIKVNYEKNQQAFSAMSVLDIKEKFMIFGKWELDRDTAHSWFNTIHGLGNATAIGVFTTRAKVPHEIWNMCKTLATTKKLTFGPIMQKAIQAFKVAWEGYDKSKSAYKIVRGISSINKLFSSLNAASLKVATVIFPGWGLFWMATSIIIESLLQEVFDWIRNRNVCVLLPLWFEGYPFISGTQGQRKLLLDGTGDANVYGRDDNETGKNNNQHADDGLWDEDYFE